MVLNLNLLYPFSHFLLFIANIWLLVWTIKLFSNRKSIAMGILIPIVLSLGYDNFILSIGYWIGESSILEILSRVRFLLHYAVVPFLIVVGVEIANLVGAGWVIPLTRVLAISTSIAICIWDIYKNLLNHSFVPSYFANTLRYIPEPPPGLPISTIAITFFILLIGFGVWVRLEGTWPWLLWSAIASFIGNALPISLVGTLPGSFVEFLLALSLVSTESFAQNKVPQLGIDEKIDFRFIYIDSNWVAIHPRPIGVVNFIGGAFFGTFPTIFYHYLLRRIYQEGYTIISYPFKNSFNHWNISIQLAQEFSKVRSYILDKAETENKNLGYEMYENLDLYRDQKQWISGNYFWLGYSVGCKYIALLEILSNPQFDKTSTSIDQVLKNYISEDDAIKIALKLKEIDSNSISYSLKNQPSILMAPVITGIESAIPLDFITNLLKFLRIDFKPSENDTKKMILGLNLFNFMAIVGFKGDTVVEKAGTIQWLISKTNRPQNFDALDQEIDRKPLFFLKWIRSLLRIEHLAPLNVFRRNEILANHLIKLLPLIRDAVISDIQKQANEPPFPPKE